MKLINMSNKIKDAIEQLNHLDFEIEDLEHLMKLSTLNTIWGFNLTNYSLLLWSKENDNVLDFFGGSGSTGEACFKLNRNFSLIQRKEKLKSNIELSDKTLEFVSDITIERLKKTNVNFEIIEY